MQENKICVYCSENSDIEYKDRAKAKATELDLPYVEDKKADYSLYLCFDENGISLCDDELMINADFTRVLKRIENTRYKQEMLYKASKFKNKEGLLRAVDATAGFGEDSAILAAAGFEVTLFERDKIIALLLEDALERAKSNPILSEIAGRMKLIKADSTLGMKELGFAPDLILLDPMFPERQKSAKVKKKFQLLQQLESPCTDGEALLCAAIEARPRKIVIKRPSKGPYLNGIKPSYSINGDCIRYDCIILNV